MFHNLTLTSFPHFDDTISRCRYDKALRCLTYTDVTDDVMVTRRRHFRHPSWNVLRTHLFLRTNLLDDFCTIDQLRPGENPKTIKRTLQKGEIKGLYQGIHFMTSFMVHTSRSTSDINGCEKKVLKPHYYAHVGMHIRTHIYFHY